ncbi:MAG TPA: LAETG motif-containing sortase-dependent surface protein [Streptomyces sp.]|nr:LAETG motif-containing sortase-dependent surface protein [Streptomyces sp.]
MSIFQNRRRSGIALGAAGLAMAGSGMMASPASAHTPRWSVDCDSVSVNLAMYSAQGGNTVTLSAGDETLKTATFGDHWSVEDLALPAHTQPLDVHLVVKAVDGDQFNVDETKTSPVCEGQEQPTPTPSVTPSEKPTPSASAVPSPSQSSSAPAAKPVDHESPAPSKDLAETGASSTTPLIAGIAAAVVVVGAGLVMLARKRRSSQA